MSSRVAERRHGGVVVANLRPTAGITTHAGYASVVRAQQASPPKFTEATAPRGGLWGLPGGALEIEYRPGDPVVRIPDWPASGSDQRLILSGRAMAHSKDLGPGAVTGEGGLVGCVGKPAAGPEERSAWAAGLSSRSHGVDCRRSSLENEMATGEHGPRRLLLGYFRLLSRS